MILLFCCLLFSSSQAYLRPISEKDVIHFRSRLILKLEQCTNPWRRDLSIEKSRILTHFIQTSKFREFKNAAVELASADHPESVDCLDQLEHDIEEYAKLGTPTQPSSLTDILDTDQLAQLHHILQKSNRPDLVEKGLHQHLHGIPAKRREHLLNEFFALKPGLHRAKRSTESRVIAREPESFEDGMLAWRTARQRSAGAGGSKWDEMGVIGDQFYHLRKVVRKRYERKFVDYCHSNIRKIIGNSSFVELEAMYDDSDQIDHISNRFQQIIGNLKDEEDRLTADHYGKFCRKIYRLVNYEGADLMSWLTAKQKLAIADMIQNPDLEDAIVYEKLYEFFTTATGDKKEEADEVITLGCRRFIAHHLGDTIAEEIEDMRVGNVSVPPQVLAATLALKHSEIEVVESAHRKISESLSICKRIYLDYDGRCDCNNHATHCDKNHVCEFCGENTQGIQCETCLNGYKRLDTKECVPTPEPQCLCNNHSTTCDDHGFCLECQDHTVGDYCELCSNGYYGDPVKGGNCVKCPCPKGGECSIDSTGLLECADCSKGHVGENCDLEASKYTTNSDTQKINVIVVDNQLF